MRPAGRDLRNSFLIQPEDFSKHPHQYPKPSDQAPKIQTTQSSCTWTGPLPAEPRGAQWVLSFTFLCFSYLLTPWKLPSAQAGAAWMSRELGLERKTRGEGNCSSADLATLLAHIALQGPARKRMNLEEPAAQVITW